MTIRFYAPCAAGATYFLSAAASAASAIDLAEQEWLIPVLAVLGGASVLLGALMLLRRRAKVDSPVVAGARERSLQRHTERQRLATQYPDADF
jgi:hypothetical protein